MRSRRSAAVVAATLMLAACAGEEDPYVLDVGTADFPAWSTMARLAEAGQVTVGTSVESAPGPEAEPGSVPVSFDVEITRMIAGALGIDLDGIAWVPAAATERERLLEDGHVDLVVASLPVTESNRQIVGFAGPYYVGGHALLVPAGTTGITTTADLAGHHVCTVGIVPDDLLPDDAERSRHDTYGGCLAELASGDADAVLGDALVLAAHVAESPGELELAGQPFGEQAYGVGVPKADDEFRAFVNEVLEHARADGRWEAAWDATVGPVLGPAAPPPVDRDLGHAPGSPDDPDSTASDHPTPR